MQKLGIALTTTVSIFSGAAFADHQNADANLVHTTPHLTIACTDQNGNSNDYSLTVYPETGLDDRYGGYFLAEFNFTSTDRISPYASPITQELDVQNNVERFLFPFIAITSDENEQHADSRTLLINNSAHTAQFDIFEQDDDYDFENPDIVVQCNIPEMGL